MDDAFDDQVRSDVEELAGVVPGDAPLTPLGAIRHSAEPVARSAFDVDRLLAGAASFAGAALTALPESLVTQTAVDVAHLLAWCTSSAWVDGDPVPQWADLSGVYRTADGRDLQLHCNFPHHAEGVVRHLGVPPDREAVAAAVARRDAAELEAELIDRGMIAALVRTMGEWDQHPHALATRHLPPVTVERLADAPAREPAPAGAPPARVLDCTRVLAGPVAGHLLASAGCDVLRLGAAHLPSVEVGVLSTGFGKRNAHVDLRTTEGRAAMDDLLAGADVWLDAYRPGSLGGLGVDPRRAAEVRPGIVVVQINAFESSEDVATDGTPLVAPWCDRRGYDSIVQSTTGVRWAGRRHAVDEDGAPLDGDAPRPRGLPVQALDHATGFLAAGVAARLVAHQREVGGSWLARLSLLRTRNRLVALAAPRPYTPGSPAVPEALRDSIDAPVGRVTAVRPFLGRWTGPPAPLGSSPPSW